jgi:hypothetical protein
MILAASNITGRETVMPKLPDPVTDRLKPIRADLTRIGELFQIAAGREIKESSAAEGWTGIRSKITKSVPTEKASTAYAEAMKLAKCIMDETDNPELLSELRLVLMRNPMQDVFDKDQRFMGQPPPLVDEVAARLAIITADTV